MDLMHQHDIDDAVTSALKEDIGSGDITALLLSKTQWVEGTIISREPMVMCGQAWANQAFRAVDTSTKVEWFVPEGAFLEQPTILATITGPARGVLTAERTALNFLQTLSATASLTREYVLALAGTGVKLLDTRKTIPGLRLAQKYAVRAGGGQNHRFGLHDAFLIKENHILASGSIKAVIARARALNSTAFLEIEVQTLAEFIEAHEAMPDRILLDNFSDDMLREAVALNTPNPIPLEVSGGVNLSNIASIASIGVDYISVGGLTKSVRAIDLSLLLQDVL